MKVILEIVKGPETGRIFEFTEPDTFLVGRAKDATFRLPEDDPYISRRHFHLEINPPRCIFRDLESTNRPSINGKIAKEKELENGDIIEVGYTQIRVAIDKQVKTKKVICLRCKAEIILIDNEKPVDFCDRCRRQIEDERRIKVQAAKPKVLCRCGKDLTEKADSDHRFAELNGKVIYSCPKCLPAGDKDKGNTIGVYEIVKLLGEGGFGKVYLVYHTPTARMVVCKKMKGLNQKDLLPRFEREIRLQRSLHHDNIIHFVDTGVDHHEPYIVSEFANGGDLNKCLLEHGSPLLASKAVKIVADSLRGLEYLHCNKIIHRDIKPENILLQNGDEGKIVPKISDFGLAKSYNNAGGSSLTRVGTGMGTLFYMAPEQMKDAKNVDERADIYSFGISLYYLLTGRFPYNFPSPLDLVMWMLKNQNRFKNKEEAFDALIRVQKQNNPMVIILSNEPIPIRERNSEISKSLAAIVDRTIQKDISKRTQTARELRERLEAL